MVSEVQQDFNHNLGLMSSGNDAAQVDQQGELESMSGGLPSTISKTSRQD